jgi:hypothetical protein
VYKKRCREEEKPTKERKSSHREEDVVDEVDLLVDRGKEREPAQMAGPLRYRDAIPRCNLL